MRAQRTLTAVLMAAAPLVVVGVAAGPAAAHGAVDSPISRVLACAPDGPHVQSAVCQAALAASGRTAFEDWDYLRVAGVQGRDREVIPDGRLCSGGVDRFQGLDLPGTDWPATPVAAGADATLRYRVTIPHQGTFRWYVTRDGYDPGQPLRWSDVEPEPFLTATDPPRVDGAYVMTGQLPDAKAGRHIVLAIWQNSDTPDTYYSCSDVVFGDGVAPAAGDDGGYRGDYGREDAGEAPADLPAGATTGSTLADNDLVAVASSRPLRVAAGSAAVLAVVTALMVSIIRRRRSG